MGLGFSANSRVSQVRGSPFLLANHSLSKGRFRCAKKRTKTDEEIRRKTEAETPP